MKRFLVLTLMLGALLVSCSDDDSGPTCPLVGGEGPALAGGLSYLIAANSLGEDYVAAPLDGEELTPMAERGLTGRAPNDLDLVKTSLYIVNSLDNNVSVVDLTSGMTTACIALGDNVNPWEFAVDPQNLDRAFVTGWVSGELIEIDLRTNRVTRRVEAGPGAEGLLVTADHVAVTLTGYDGAENVYENGTVVVFDKSTLTEAARLEVPPNAQDIFPSVDGRYHVVCTGNYVDVFGQVVRVEADWSAVRDTLALGGSPARAVVTPPGAAVDMQVAFLPSYFGGILTYDTENFVVVHGVDSPLRSDLGYTALDYFGGYLYAANFETDTVEEISPATGEVLREFLAGDGPAVVLGVALPLSEGPSPY